MKAISALDHHDAWVAIKAAHEIIQKSDKPFVMVIVDTHGEVLTLFRHAAVMLSSINVATNKAYTAARLRRPSSAVGQKSRSTQEGFDITFFGDSRITGFGGGLPIVYEGEVIGAVGVSGLPEADNIAVAQSIIDSIEAHWKP